MTILVAVGMLREARIAAGPDVGVAVGGGRADGLARALEQAMGPDITAVISLGIAGGLDPALKVGDLVLGTEVVAADGRYQTNAAWTGRLATALPTALQAPVWGSAVMVIDAGDKARLRASSGAAVVDMESHVAGRFAQARGLNFAVMRVVSDKAGTSLPPAVLKGLKPDGSPNLAGVLLGLARQPSQLAALIRLGRDSEHALKGLAAARAAAGPAFAQF